MSDLGNRTLEDTFDFHFTTRQFSTGAPFTLAGTPVVSAYEANSTTQITAGLTITEDFDSVTGLNHVRVVATAANGYEAAKDYSIVITTGTVDSVSVVGEVVGYFSIAHRNDDVNVEQISDDSTAADNLELDYDGTGYAKANSTIGTCTLTATTTDVTNEVDADVTAISGDSTAADRLEAAMDGVVTGAAATGTLTTTVMTTDLTEATDDHYIGRIVTFTSGALLGQSTDITDYAGTNGTVTMTALTEAPSDGDTFTIQ